ncbi:hypothetical protein [Agreia sp. Leaf335]|uniref:hypothetical protein n=1 Tax=Agreia sp. Leaf335 TaxID=1736340 RepID=UPI000A565529|nr:hypothetical protein [Agreia sp. Leaf335]
MTHNLSVELLGFPNRYARQIEIDVSREELFLAAITTGKGGDLLGTRIPFTVGELVWKLGVLDGCVEFDESGRLNINDGVALLDPSEKSALAYILSNAQTGLIANRVLGATHVLHLKALSLDRSRRTAGVRNLPDFVGIDALSLNTFVIETKGTVRRKVDAEAERKAILQLGTRVSLKGYRNTLRYAHYSEFPNGVWRARLQYESGRSNYVQSTGGRALWAYYFPLVDWLQKLPARVDSGSRYRWAKIGELNVEFGISHRVVDAVEVITRHRSQLPESSTFATELLLHKGDDFGFDGLKAVARDEAMTQNSNDGEVYMGADGLAVRSSS